MLYLKFAWPTVYWHKTHSLKTKYKVHSYTFYSDTNNFVYCLKKTDTHRKHKKHSFTFTISDGIQDPHISFTKMAKKNLPVLFFYCFPSKKRPKNHSKYRVTGWGCWKYITNDLRLEEIKIVVIEGASYQESVPQNSSTLEEAVQMEVLFTNTIQR